MRRRSRPPRNSLAQATAEEVPSWLWLACVAASRLGTTGCRRSVSCPVFRPRTTAGAPLPRDCSAPPSCRPDTGHRSAPQACRNSAEACRPADAAWSSSGGSRSRHGGLPTTRETQRCADERADHRADLRVSRIAAGGGAELADRETAEVLGAGHSVVTSRGIRVQKVPVDQVAPGRHRRDRRGNRVRPHPAAALGRVRSGPAGRDSTAGLLRPRVVLHGDVGQTCDFLTPKPRSTARAAGRQTDVLRPQPLPRTAEKPSQVLAIHSASIIRAATKARPKLYVDDRSPDPPSTDDCRPRVDLRAEISARSGRCLGRSSGALCGSRVLDSGDRRWPEAWFCVLSAAGQRRLRCGGATRRRGSRSPMNRREGGHHVLERRCSGECQ